MSLVRVPRQSGDHAAGTILPVRSIESGESRDKIDTAVISDGAGQSFYVRAGSNQTQVVAQPLHQGAGDGDTALERVYGRRLAELVTQGREETTLGEDGILARIHQQEASGPVG